MILSTLLRASAVALPLAFGSMASAQGLPLSEEVRATSQTALQDTLLDLMALRHAAHQAHWNVVGSDFYQLHEFFEELYSGVAPFIDDVGGRMRSLGLPVDGRPASVAEAGRVTADAPAEAQGPDAVAALHDDWRAVSDALYARIEAVSDDAPTQDLLIAITATIDKQRWFLRAHTQ